MNWKKERNKLKKWVTRNWGKRCKSRCPNCALCQAWDQYDFLTNSTKVQPKCCDTCE